MATPTVEKCRLVTRSDFDGLVCAALLKELGMLDEIKFVHPKDVQDGLVEITDRDITTNLRPSRERDAARHRQRRQPRDPSWRPLGRARRL
jgi:hypothetical protein